MNYLSTGQASKLLSVTSDTILKWIKHGRIKAVRTPGGHYRVPEIDIRELVNRTLDKAAPNTVRLKDRDLLYCWEFFARKGKPKDECGSCLVLRAQALKCFEMSHLSAAEGFHGTAAITACERCSYFRYQLGWPFNVLVITDNEEAKASLQKDGKKELINMQFASCEYECSILIERFRPDFVVVDCTMQENKCRELCYHLSNDPRIRGNALILATPPRRLSISLPGTIRLQHPFSVDKLMSFLKQHQACNIVKSENPEGVNQGQ
ncbi:MAG: helix-turn-helix domain-containing protein [Pseudomonadota bacterium]